MKPTKDTFFAALAVILFAALFILALWIGTVNHRANMRGIGGSW